MKTDEGLAIAMLRPGVGERIRGTRLDVLPATHPVDGDQVWIGDGDAGEVLLKIPAAHVEHFIEYLQRALGMLADKPPAEQWFRRYKTRAEKGLP